VLYYEQFLFTRNTRRDFTAFVRPEAMTNQDVSALAGMFGLINDVTWLTPKHPALYCFPLGAYTFLLRFYNSGRLHAGRPIAVLEGMAVQRRQTRAFADAIHNFIRLQYDYLNVVDTLRDIETQEVKESGKKNLLITRVKPPKPADRDREAIRIFAERQEEARLHVPFTDVGLNILVAALTDSSIPPLIRFAYGTNADVVARLNHIDVELDVIAYFSHGQPSLRHRDTGDTLLKYGAFEDVPFVPPKPPEPPRPATQPKRPKQLTVEPQPASRPTQSPADAQVGGTSTQPHQRPEKKPAFDYGPEDRGVLTPREMRRKALELAEADTPIDSTDEVSRVEKTLFGDQVLTPREMRRKFLEEQAANAEAQGDLRSHNWFVRLIRRLFGRS
jgi:hypothetical protein